jgi:plastocyanin
VAIGRSAHRFGVCLALAALAAGGTSARARADGVSGSVRVSGRPAKDVVLWLDVGTAERPGSRASVILDQRNMRFSPRVLAVPVGTTVQMPNSDRVFHNVFSFRDGKVFDLGLYPVGSSKNVTFDRPGLSRIFCNIHPAMAAYVLAVDSHHVGVSDAQGRFSLPEVADGAYTYHAWRPGADRVTGTLVVQRGHALEVALP